jgi:hypothetical protein
LAAEESVMASRCVLVIRGINNPLSVAAISSFAEALGVVVPIPVWAKELDIVSSKNTTVKNLIILLLL